jgi:hypothetical protein
MTSFSKIQKVTILALVLALLFNPMSYEILKDYIEWGFNIIALISTAWCMGFLLYKALKPEKINIPKKGVNKTSPKYLED